MSLRINGNINSLIAQRLLTNSSRSIARSLQQLASGKRINSAGDDPAGLAIGQSLKSGVSSLRRGVQNINETKALLETASGAINELTSITQRLRELSLQSANGTLSESERGFVAREFIALREEYDRIVTSTNFNGRNLLDGSLSAFDIQVGSDKLSSIDVEIPSARAEDVFTRAVGQLDFEASGAGPAGRELVLGDIDGDGQDEVIGVGRNVFYSRFDQSTGEFSSSIRIDAIGSGVQEVKATDFNGDGLDDLIVLREAGGSVTVETFLNEGEGQFSLVQAEEILGGDSDGFSISNMTLSDFNNDGIEDLAVSDGAKLIKSILIGSDGRWTVESTFSVSAMANVLSGDYNQDGVNDILYSSPSGGIIGTALGDGSGSFSVSETFAFGLNYDHIQQADLDGDGDIDLVGIDGGIINTLINNGQGQFSLGQSFEGTFARSLVLGDLNDDGRIDIFTGAGQAFENDGAGQFTARNTGTAPIGIIGLNPSNQIIIDLNNDGIVEVLSGSFGFVVAQKYSQSTELETAASRLQIDTQENAQKSLEILSNGLDNLSALQASLGAQITRLNSAAQVSLITSESLAAAASQIEDADIAELTAELVRVEILREAQLVGLQQANLDLRNILQLLSSIAN